MANNSNENRASRFKRVAERRTDNILKAIRILGNCSNKSAYQYSDEEVQKIFRVIDEQLRSTKARFHRSRPIKFTLH
jgi:hypothetical protein